MAEKAPIRDSIGDNELKVYYTGDVDTSIDDALISAMKSAGFEFKGMNHMYDYIHRMLFVKEG